jgi:hypothetical protein
MKDTKYVNEWQMSNTWNVALTVPLKVLLRHLLGGDENETK